MGKGKRWLTWILALVLLLGNISWPGLCTKAAEKEEVLETWERREINFNRSWKFIRKDVENAWKEEYDDHSWYNVGLPHDFSIPYWQEERHYTGYGWYRKTFEISEAWNKKQILLDFDGVFHTAEVYVNGQKVGMHEGGYTGFEMDITDCVRTGENVIAIRVNNNWKADLAPRAGEHMFTGGIYRDVRMIVISPVHVTWYGTFVQTPDLSKESSKVRMQAEVKNDSEAGQKVQVTHRIYDAEENLVAAITSDERKINAGDTWNFDDTSETIQNPHLWSTEDPYLYKVITEVMANGKNVDQYETTFGFRQVTWTSDQGFFLNGEHVWLNGANAHQDHAGWANAVTDDALKRDVAMIKEAGLNFIRGSHYPHAPAYAQACDEQGILFWCEASFWCTGYWNEGGGNGNSDDYRCDGYPQKAQDQAAFEQSCLNQVRDMIRINRNHPSVVIWSMGNELFFGQNLDKKKALASKMAAYAKELDPTRSTALGGTQRSETDKLDNIDVAGYNGDGAEISEYQNPGVANMVAEYGSHTGNRPDQFKVYYGSVQTDASGEPIRYPWRSGIALWCAFHHGSIVARSYGDMGFIDYYRLPLQSWYYYREKNTGKARECSVRGTAAKLSLKSTYTEISNDGTKDTQLIVTAQNEAGQWVGENLEVTLEVVSGPGVFPTGKSITFEPGDGMRDGKAAIEFRSYYAGETVIRAYCAANPEIEEAKITICTTGEGDAKEPDVRTMYGTFMGDGGDVPNTVEEPEAYAYHNYNGAPMHASSGDDSLTNALDGDLTTEWKASTPGSSQWIYLEAEHGGINLYKAKLVFKGKVYPYKIQYKEMNIDEDEWKTLKEYDSTSIKNRPEEETFNGVYMRYFRIEFTDVPEDAYANIAEIQLCGLRSDTVGYQTGVKYLSDLSWNDESVQETWAGRDVSLLKGRINVGGEKYSKGVSVQTDSALVYELSGEAARYARFQCVVGADAKTVLESPVTLRVYCDDELMYEKKISDVKQSEKIDISVNKVKKLKLEAETEKGSSIINWADAILLGAIRNISTDESEVKVCYTGNMETLQAGKRLQIRTNVQNLAEDEKELEAGIFLYDETDNLIASRMQPVNLNSEEIRQITMQIGIPSDLKTGSKARFVLWDRETLLPAAEIVPVWAETKQTENLVDEKIVQPDEQRVQKQKAMHSEEQNQTIRIFGRDERLEKEGDWGYWDSSEAAGGYETFITSTTASMFLQFTGTRMKIAAKKDGSQRGAKIYIDGVFAKEVSTYLDTGENIYTEVFASEELPYGTHTVKICPVGKFGLEYIEYFTGQPEDDTELARLVEEYKNYQENDYAQGWEEFTEALDYAQSLLDADVTQSELDRAAENLKEAAGNLVLDNGRDESGLKTILGAASRIIYCQMADLYMEASRHGFTDAMEDANRVLNDRTLGEEEVDKAEQNLQRAVNALKRKNSSEDIDPRPDPKPEPIPEPEPTPTPEPTPGQTSDTEKLPAKGTVFEDGKGLCYKVTRANASKGEVTVLGTKRKSSRVIIPASVKKDGCTFKVTAVAAKAFQKNQRLKTLVLGKNIRKIGIRSFYKNKKLKNIVFKSKNSVTIGKQAFKEIKVTAKVTVSKNMSKKNLKKLKKGMKSAGNKIRFYKKYTSLQLYK